MSKDKLSNLKRKRECVKRRVTDFNKYVNEKISFFESEGNLDRITIIEVKGRLDRINSALDLFYEIHSQIEEYDSSNADEELDQFENDFYAVTARAKLLIENNSQVNTSIQQSNVSQISANEVSSLKLPAMHLPKFKGVHTNWLEFRDVFHSMIHTNESLSKVQKFYYLKSSLEGEAASVIQSIKMSNDNYDIAWSLLCERFNNKRLLVQNHVRALYSVDQILKESPIALRQIIYNINHHLRSLKILGIETDTWDPAVIYFITSKLDSITIREWESQIFGSELPTLSELLNFLKNRADMLDNLKSKTCDTKSNKFGLNSMLSNISCHFCNSSHTIYVCEKFKILPVEQRISEAKRLKLCLNCLRPGHSNFSCNSSGCIICKYKHNSLLHLSKKISAEPTTSGTVRNEATTSSTVAHIFDNNYVLLSTALIRVQDVQGTMHTFRALLDAGSQSCFISEKVKNQLQIKVASENVAFISGVNNTRSNITGKCQLLIHSMQTSYCTNIDCYILPKICNILPQFTFNLNCVKIPKNLIAHLADPNLNVPGEIDILLGANIVSKIMTTQRIDLGKNSPTMFNSRLGWVLLGPISFKSLDIRCNFTETIELQQQLSRFWELEEIVECKPLSDDEFQCERHFLENYTRNHHGRFVVKIPLKLSVDKLGNSSIGAERRFYSLERKLQSNSYLRNLYSDFMREYEMLNHMTCISIEKINPSLYFLPHHCVLREDSKTTRLRVVFDASFSTDSGYSRNNIERVGPIIQDDLFSILLRFRQHSIAISADIKKMYRQVLVHPDDRHLQVIFWRKNPSHPLRVFQLNTITYGTASGSYLATRCLQELAKLNVNFYPEASNVIEHDFYVDDLLTGTDNIESGKLLCTQIDSILKSGCFELSKWASNDISVFSNIRSRENTLNCSVALSDSSEITKVLGLHWNPNEDFLFFKINTGAHKDIVTKRTILSLISQIFDPLGLLSACLITAKIILQHLWREQIGWDEEVPKDIKSKWLKFRSDLLSLNDLRVPRYILSKPSEFIQLHGFADASENAYAACVYVKSIDQLGHTSVRLLCAKTKVAPVKTLTIPKLELCAALILSKLVNKVSASLRITVDSTYLWTDSTVVLGWLAQSENTLKIFVAHRVAQIRNLVKKVPWRHVPTLSNPADLASRGINSVSIVNSTLWWHGPHWLRENPDRWPILNISKVEDLPELKIKASISSLVLNNSSPLIQFERFSSLIRLQRTVAYVLRFLENCKTSKNQRKLSHLDTSDISKALMMIVKLIQNNYFKKEIKCLESNCEINRNSRILSLTPFLDNNRILRVGGRLENSELHFDAKHPILLPASHHVVDLIFKHEHVKLGHAGPTQLLCSVRDQFWPIKGKIVAKRIVKNCIRCFRARPFNKAPLMGALPTKRVTPSFPFQTIGIDYAGPFLIKSKKGRGAKTSKCYISLFVCFSTKAVHIEVTADYSSEEFLASLKRFIARRGKPSDIYSDNAKNYVGAKNELERLIRSFETEPIVTSYLSFEGINWHFIPPYSPHQGGIWEAAIKKTKFHLKRMLNTVTPTFQEFYTMNCLIEAILNSRPLTPLSNNPADLEALTPSHFLIGRKLNTLPERDVSEINPNRLTAYHRMQHYIQMFWRRWKSEYLATLVPRSKWKTRTESLKPDMMVIVADNNLPTMQWLLGRIVEVHPGQDGNVRVATVRTCRGNTKRAATKLFPLPIDGTSFKEASSDPTSLGEEEAQD